MSLYKTFKTDGNLEKSGVWLEYGYVDGDESRPVRIKIARAGGSNTKFAKIFEAKTKPYRRQIQTETLDDKVAAKLFIEVYAEAVVLAWENVQDEHGNDLAFTRENVVKVLSDLDDLWADIQEQAKKAALFRAEVLEADSGN